MLKLDEYKFSKYNHKILLENKLYLYNAYSGGFFLCNDLLKNTFINISFGTDSTTVLKELPEYYISELKRGSFIIDKDLDELKLIKSKHYLARFGNRNVLSLTLIPTHACNFRCPYCFEASKKYPTDRMSHDVINAVEKLVNENLEQQGQLSITWFGGEPLLAIDLIEEIQIKMQDIANRKCITFNSGIITNGYLLTEEVSNKLVDLGITFAQITLDGNREMHNTKRFLSKNKTGSFDTILQNIITSNKNLNLAIRINIDEDNVETIPSLIDNLIELGLNKKENVQVYFAIIKDFDSKKSALCSYLSVKDFADTEIELLKYAESKGLKVKQKINPNIGLCSSLSPNSYVIEPNGLIQKCWGNVGNPDDAVGSLLFPKDYNDKYLINQSKWYSWSPFDKEECRECSILPLCMGGCPLYTMDDMLDDSYKCHTFKHNLKEILALIAKQHLSGKK